MRIIGQLISSSPATWKRARPLERIRSLEV
jgi:hypothetical protein